MSDVKAEVLVVVDMQNDFITGSLGSEAAQAIVPNVVEKVKAYKDQRKQVYFTRDTHYDDYLNTLEGEYLPVKHCINNSEGWKICEELKQYAEPGYVIDKHTFGWLHDYLFDQYIKDPESIEVCGLCTDICVVSNALILRAKYPKTKIYVDPTCCAGTKHSLHLEALNVMESCQIEII